MENIIDPIEKLESITNYQLSKVGKMAIVITSIFVIITMILLNGAAATHHARQAEYIYRLIIFEVLILFIVSMREAVKYGMSLYNPNRWVIIKSDDGTPFPIPIYHLRKYNKQCRKYGQKKISYVEFTQKDREMYPRTDENITKQIIEFDKKCKK
jgi:hypothetical protein